MTDLITLAVIGVYLLIGTRFVIPFARDHVAAALGEFDTLYESRSERARLNREAVWVGIFKALVWVWVLLARWITRHLVDNLTAPERKAEELKAARKIIADYEAEQARTSR